MAAAAAATQLSRATLLLSLGEAPLSKRKNTPPNAIYLPDDTMADCKSHIVYSECEISLWIRRHRRIVLIRTAPTSPHFANTIYMLSKNSDFANFLFLCEGSAWNEIVLFGETTVLCFRIYYPPAVLFREFKPNRLLNVFPLEISSRFYKGSKRLRLFQIIRTYLKVVC